MTRRVAVARLIPIVGRALGHAEPEILASCPALIRPAVRHVLAPLIRHATPLMTRIAVEVAAEVLAPVVRPLVGEALEFFEPQAIHPGVATALRESIPHE